MSFFRNFRVAAYAVAFGAMLPSAAGAQSAEGMGFFITSAGPGKGANLGGLAGADAHCEDLAEAAGAGSRVWRAYLSTQASAGTAAVNARDRIGSGPWYNAKGVKVAASVADLHSADNKLNKENSLSEKGDAIKGRGDSPNQHDILTGSRSDGTAFGAGGDSTCANWTSETTGGAAVGHHDRQGGGADPTSWNFAHISSGCSQANLIGTGGNGYFYCFAADGATGMESPARDRRLTGFAFLGQGGTARFPFAGGEPPVYTLDLRESRFVRISIRTLTGRTLAEPVAEILAAGKHEVRWNGMDRQGNQVPRGFYLLSIASGDTRP